MLIISYSNRLRGHDRELCTNFSRTEKRQLLFWLNRITINCNSVTQIAVDCKLFGHLKNRIPSMNFTVVCVGGVLFLVTCTPLILIYVLCCDAINNFKSNFRCVKGKKRPTAAPWSI